jgi:hypothetical protein
MDRLDVVGLNSQSGSSHWDQRSIYHLPAYSVFAALCIAPIPWPEGSRFSHWVGRRAKEEKDCIFWFDRLADGEGWVAILAIDLEIFLRRSRVIGKSNRSIERSTRKAIGWSRQKWDVGVIWLIDLCKMTPFQELLVADETQTQRYHNIIPRINTTSNIISLSIVLPLLSAWSL